jgi:hypothetical protein
MRVRVLERPAFACKVGAFLTGVDAFIDCACDVCQELVAADADGRTSLVGADADAACVDWAI